MMRKRSKKWKKVKGRPPIFQDVETYRDFIAEKSVRKFETRDQARAYLETEVFSLDEFQSHMQETAEGLNLPLDKVREVIEDYLSNVLYELDANHHLHKRELWVHIPQYLRLDAGFMTNAKGFFRSNQFARQYRVEKNK